jgi:hypothetical protein
MEQTKIYPSKLFGYFAFFEWGLRDLEFLGPHSFRAKGKDDKYVSFFCHVEDHKDYSVSIPETDNDFVMLCMMNNAGDNCVLMRSKDCAGRRMTLQEIAPLIKKKWIANKLEKGS